MLDKPHRDRNHQKKTNYEDRFNRRPKNIKGEKRARNQDWNDMREDHDIR